MRKIIFLIILSFLHCSAFAQDTLYARKNTYVQVQREDSITLIYNIKNPLNAADFESACFAELSKKSSQKLWKIFKRTVLNQPFGTFRGFEQYVIIMLYATCTGDVQEMMIYTLEENKMFKADKIEQMEKLLKNKRKFKLEIDTANYKCNDTCFYKIQYPIHFLYPDTVDVIINLRIR